MELRDIKTFLTVADLLNFNQAGLALHTAQSTVSVRVQTLEDELGVRLFDRLGRRIRLTEAGERLLKYARKMLDLEEEARAWVAGDEKARGALTVRMPESLATHRLSGVLSRFSVQFPNVRLKFIPCTFDSLAKDLRQGVTDLAFLLADAIQARDLEAELLGTEPLAVVASAEHSLSKRAGLEAKDFQGETVVLSTTDCSYRRVFERLLAEEGVTPNLGFEFSSLAALVRCVAGGVGFTVLPAVAAQEHIASGALKALDWGEADLETGVLMVRHKDKWLSPALAGFMALARESLVPGN